MDRKEAVSLLTKRRDLLRKFEKAEKTTVWAARDRFDCSELRSFQYGREANALDMALAALEQPTDPLTQEDLNKMFLETVWLQYPDGSGEPALVVNGRIYSVANLEGAGLDLEEYCPGESLESRTGEYMAYRRPPGEGGPRHGG